MSSVPGIYHDRSHDKADSEDDSMLDLVSTSMCLDLLDGIETEKKVPSDLRLSTLAKKLCDLGSFNSAKMLSAQWHSS